MQRCGISVPKAQKLCAQQGAIPLKREPSEAVSEGQKLKRKSKSLILSLELTQRADFVTRAYTACRFCSSSLYSVVEPMQREGSWLGEAETEGLPHRNNTFVGRALLLQVKS